MRASKVILSKSEKIVWSRDEEAKEVEEEEAHLPAFCDSADELFARKAPDPYRNSERENSSDYETPSLIFQREFFPARE